MKALVFVPGIMGTKLLGANDEELWPPTALETQFGYGRVDKLLAEDVRFGEIIRSVMCFDFYGSLIDQFAELQFRPDDGAKRLYLFPYDWRRDLENTAERLAAQLDAVDRDGADEIHLVAHSMGGLVTRLVLETGKFANKPWIAKIKSFIALAVPHQGAPLALARVLGLDSTLGISKSDFRRIGNDRRYPSGYQLLPAPKEEACWNQDLALHALDIYDAATAARLGLDTVLLARARSVHEALAAGAPPSHVRYFYFAGTGHETVTRVNVTENAAGAFSLGDMKVTRTEGAGDGTVPFWSALPRSVQKQIVVNEHAHVFQGMPFKRVFYRLLGGDLGPALQKLDLDDAAEKNAGAMRMSISTPIVQCAKEYELLLVPHSPTPSIDARVSLQRLNERGMPAAPAEEVSKVLYEGPPVSWLRLLMPPIVGPGLYQLVSTGTPSMSEPLRFAAVAMPPEP
jgi:pimeloyl-ACP methyl ester carboxylesterase